MIFQVSVTDAGLLQTIISIAFPPAKYSTVAKSLGPRLLENISFCGDKRSSSRIVPAHNYQFYMNTKTVVKIQSTTTVVIIAKMVAFGANTDTRCKFRRLISVGVRTKLGYSGRFTKKVKSVEENM